MQSKLRDQLREVFEFGVGVEAAQTPRLEDVGALVDGHREMVAGALQELTFSAPQHGEGEWEVIEGGGELRVEDGLHEAEDEYF